MRIIGDKHEAIGYVSHKTLVYFAVENAHYAYQNYARKQYPKVQNCIDLTRKWLQDQSSVSADQLKEAADATAHYAAHYATANVAAYAARTAACAADAAHYAAANVAYAAHYAVYAADKNKLNEQNRQGTFILKFFGVE